MKQLWLICSTVIIVVLIKYGAPLIEKSMDIEFIKWMQVPKVFGPPNLAIPGSKI